MLDAIRGRGFLLPWNKRSRLNLPAWTILDKAAISDPCLKHFALFFASVVFVIEGIQALVKHYSVWLGESTSLREVEDHVEITTPYLDRHNDYLQIYVKRTNDGFILTDDGYVIDDLEMSGYDIDIYMRSAIFAGVLNGFGVQSNGKALEVKASVEDFPLRMHNLMQTMLAVGNIPTSPHQPEPDCFAKT